VLFHVSLAGLAGMVHRILAVAASSMGMMICFFVLTALVMLRSFIVVPRGVRVTSGFRVSS
jgi:hypothetical protein